MEFVDSETDAGYSFPVTTDVPILINSTIDVFQVADPASSSHTASESLTGSYHPLYKNTVSLTSSRSHLYLVLIAH